MRLTASSGAVVIVIATFRTVRLCVRASARFRACVRGSPSVWASSPPGELVPPAPSDPALRSKVNEIQRLGGLLHGQAHLHADKHTVQNAAMTLEEAVSRMKLQLQSLPVKRWRKRKSTGGNRHLQDAKKHARQISLDEIAGGGLAKSRYRVSRADKLFLFCSPVSPSWAERDLIPL